MNEDIKNLHLTVAQQEKEITDLQRRIAALEMSQSRTNRQIEEVFEQKFASIWRAINDLQSYHN